MLGRNIYTTGQQTYKSRPPHIRLNSSTTGYTFTRNPWPVLKPCQSTGTRFICCIRRWRKKPRALYELWWLGIAL